MSELLKVEYKGYELRYSESLNNWNCDVFSRPAESLAKAKERIDARIKNEGKEKFGRIEVYHSPSGSEVSKVTVTSLVDDGKGVWITKDGTRRKVEPDRWDNNAFSLFTINDKNTSTFAQIAAARKQIAEQEVKITELRKALERWKP